MGACAAIRRPRRSKDVRGGPEVTECGRREAKKYLEENVGRGRIGNEGPQLLPVPAWREYADA